MVTRISQVPERCFPHYCAGKAKAAPCKTPAPGSHFGPFQVRENSPSCTTERTAQPRCWRARRTRPGVRKGRLLRSHLPSPLTNPASSLPMVAFTLLRGFDSHSWLNYAAQALLLRTLHRNQVTCFPVSPESEGLFVVPRTSVLKLSPAGFLALVQGHLKGPLSELFTPIPLTFTSPVHQSAVPDPNLAGSTLLPLEGVGEGRWPGSTRDL